MNKPVAYIHKTISGWTSTFIHPETKPDEWLSLYTHPVKESYRESHEGFSTVIEAIKAHPVKELTDEEIDQAIKDCGYDIEETVMGKFVDIEGINMYNSLCGFAKAILRKAQEK